MGYKGNDRCIEKADADEPLFVLRAQDRLMIPTIRFWLDQAHATLTPEHHAEVGELVNAADRWQREHADRVKLPD